MTRIFVYETVSADPLCRDPVLASQGRSMRNAMLADLTLLDDVRASVAVAGTDPKIPAHSPADASVVRRVRRIPRYAHQPAVEFLRQQAAMHDLVWVAAPESRGLLSSLRAVVPDRQWLGCSQSAIDIGGSKRATATHLAAAGIAATRPLDPFAAPETARDGPQSAADVGSGRWIVKPDDGCGACGARRHDDYAAACADYASRRSRREDVVLEPWIEGEPLSLALMCSRGQVELLAVNRQRISCDEAGWLRFDGVAVDAAGSACRPAMAALARRILAALPGLSGFVGVDVTWHPAHGPIVVEVNPRITCAYEGLSAIVGRNIAQLLLARHQPRQGSSDLRTAASVQWH